MVQPLVEPYVLNPADPRAPTWEQWERMSQNERRRVVALLPPEDPAELMRLRAEQEADRVEAQRRRVSELEAQLSEEQRAREALAQVRDTLAQELEAARAEIERLKRR
jgi:hypothetical protein